VAIAIYSHCARAGLPFKRGEALPVVVSSEQVGNIALRNPSTSYGLPLDHSSPSTYFRTFLGKKTSGCRTALMSGKDVQNVKVILCR